MLTKGDVDWIKSNRKETTKNRTTPITLYGEDEKGKHPITGEPRTETIKEEVDALVTEMESAFKTDISFEGGVLVEKGDLWVVIDIDDINTDIRSMSEMEYDGAMFVILAADKSGLGAINRVIIVARRES